VKPEYLEELADIADPDQLWRLPPFTQMELPPEKRKQLDTGVALRRYASHLRDLATAANQGKSLVLTRVGMNTTRISYRTPPKAWVGARTEAAS
jgi:hypothetical protein